jgi:hypothetical protein
MENDKFEIDGEGCAKSLFWSFLVSIGTLPLFGWVGFGIGAFIFTALTEDHNIFLGGLLCIGAYWLVLWVAIYFVFFRK